MGSTKRRKKFRRNNLGSGALIMINRISTLNRRSFLQYGSAAALALPLVGWGALELESSARDSLLGHLGFDSKNSIPSWKIMMVSDKEPGDPLVISGTIYAVDGR